MAAFVIRNGFVSIDAIDLSNHCRSASVEMAYDDVDVTSMGAGAHQHLPGLRSDRFTLEMYSDFASSSVNDTLAGKFAGGTTAFVIHVASNSSTATATNPVYSGTCFLLTYNPISGAVGDASMTPLEFVPSNGTITALGTISTG